MSDPELYQDRADRLMPGLCRVGGVAAFALIGYCLAILVQMMFLGGQPSSAAEAFHLLQTNRVVGLLRLDLLTIFAAPLYYPLFLALSAALWRVDGVKAILSALFVFAGVTLVLATPMALSTVPLSVKYAAATTDTARGQFLAAGEAILAMDMWHGTSAIVGGLLAQAGAILICIAMLKSADFSRFTGWLGLVMHGLDLLHIVIGLFLPAVGAALLVTAGSLYPIWFFLAGRSLLRLARNGFRDAATMPAFGAGR